MKQAAELINANARIRTLEAQIAVADMKPEQLAGLPTPETDAHIKGCDSRIGFAFAQLRSHANKLEQAKDFISARIICRTRDMNAEILRLTDEVRELQQLQGAISDARLDAFRRIMGKQLTEAQSANLQLREALEKCEHADDCEWRTPLERWPGPCTCGRNKALTSPPPPVVPLSDVGPLLHELEDLEVLAPHSEECGCSDCEVFNSIEQALATFRAKHPTV
jgi:hypothetical protein